MDLASSNGLWAIEDESLALAGDDAIELRAAWLIAGTLSPPIEVATRPAGLGASDSAVSWMKLYGRCSGRPGNETAAHESSRRIRHSVRRSTGPTCAPAALDNAFLHVPASESGRLSDLSTRSSPRISASAEEAAVSD
jgi:hypothetical protein